MAASLTLNAYRVAAVALLAALAVAALATHQPDPTAPPPVIAVVVCAVMLGCAYYLGRTRPARGRGQQLNRPARVISVFPILGLVLVPMMGGLYRLTRRRLYIRNIAISAGWVVFGLLGSDPSTASGTATTCLLLAGLALAVLITRRLPAAPAPVPAVPAPVPAAPAPVPAAPAPVPAAPAAGPPPVAPVADQIVIVSLVAAAARSLYWLVGAIKFGTIFLILGLLAPNDVWVGGWGAAIVGGIAALPVLAMAVLIQEDRIRPAAGVILALVLISAICYPPIAFGVLTGSQADQGVVGWAIVAFALLWLYRRKRRSARLDDAEIQAIGRIGHLRPRSARSRRVPSPGQWIRGAIVMLCAIPIVVVSLFNTLIGVAVISDWIGAGLDKLYEFVRGQAVPLLAAPQDTKRITIGLANSPEPGAWRLLVRGDLIQWGKLGPQRVPFEEFLRLRLEASGEVRTIVPGQSGPADLVVMPIGVPHPDHVLDAVAAAAAHAPLLLPVQPIGARPMKQWPLFVQQMRARGIGLPAVDDPVRTIAVLRQATGTTTVYLAAARQQWGYLAMLHHVLRYGAPAVTFPHLDPSGR